MRKTSQKIIIKILIFCVGFDKNQLRETFRNNLKVLYVTSEQFVVNIIFTPNTSLHLTQNI